MTAQRKGTVDLRSSDASGKRVQIVHISDTHNEDYDQIPEGDILVHSGDFTNCGHPGEVAKFNAYLRRQPHPIKIVVPGNHECEMDKMGLSQLQRDLFTGVQGECFVLVDSAVSVMGIKFYGSPWTTAVGQGWGVGREELANKWKSIPADTEVLITHMPPFNILDLAWQRKGWMSKWTGDDGVCRACNKAHPNFKHWGCERLREMTESLPRLRLHCFGHVHDETGLVVHRTEQGKRVLYSNAAMDIKRQCNALEIIVDGISSGPHNDGKDGTKQDASMVGQLCVAGLTNSKGSLVALDVDAHDPEARCVMLWRALRGPPENQTWSIETVLDYEPRGCSEGERPVRIVSGVSLDGDKRLLTVAPSKDGVKYMVECHSILPGPSQPTQVWLMLGGKKKPIMFRSAALRSDLLAVDRDMHSASLVHEMYVHERPSCEWNLVEKY